MKYEVEVTKTTLYQLEIEANSHEEAENKAIKLVNSKNGSEYLDDTDTNAEAYCPEEEEENEYEGL